jgi:hypothetical protein
MPVARTIIQLAHSDASSAYEIAEFSVRHLRTSGPVAGVAVP